MRGLLYTFALLVSGSFATAQGAQAQTGTVAGRVTDSTTKVGVGSARIQVVNGATTVASVIAGEDGAYRVANVPVGTYAVVVTRIGYTLKRVADVRVESGQTATVDVAMAQIAAQLNQVVTTASRAPEKILDAPASIAIVDTREIEERPSVTVADHIRSVPGLSVSQGGLGQSNIVARGFNNAFSGQLLTLQDYRFAGVPSLRVNVPMLFTSTNEDIERIEVLLGPASALYGPNSANGVLHVITKSPFDSKGTTLTIDGGQRSLMRGAFRHANTMGSKVGYKVSGEYFTAKDWEYRDLAEPDTFPSQAPAARRGQPNVRDFDLNRFAGEARVDVRPTANTEWISTYGFTRIGSGLELTGANGTAQVKDWRYQSLQERFRWNRLFMQAFVNFSDAGNADSLDTRGTYLLRSGQPIVDQSRVFAAQIQHATDLGTKQGFVYGLDYIFTNPRTGGTISGRNEGNDNVTEVGGYVQSTTRLTSQFDLIGAARVDQHNRIDGTQFSPRVALVFKPTETQNFRATYNRAFQTPANFSYFLDLVQARNVGGSGFDVRAMGNPPKTGWQFARSCDQNIFGGLCMKSPFTGNGQFMPATAATVLPAMVTRNSAALQAGLAPSIAALLQSQGMPPAQAQAAAQQQAQALVQYMASLSPTAAQVGTKVRYITATNVDLKPTDIRDIEALKAAYNTTYELGYKGILGNRARLAVDAWYQKRGDVGTPAGVATPNVFFDPASLNTYLTAALTPALMAQGLPQATAAAAAAQIAGTVSTSFAPAPLGVVTFNSALADPNAIIATYQVLNKTVDVRGVDIALDFLATDKLTLTGGYDWVNKQIFEQVKAADGSVLALNAPTTRVTLAGKWRDEGRGLGAELRGRYTNDFPVESGVYSTLRSFQQAGKPPCTAAAPANCFTYEPVEAATLVDAGFSWRLPIATSQQISWSINASNLLDKKVRTFAGVPAMGRMLTTRLQYAF